MLTEFGKVLIFFLLGAMFVGVTLAVSRLVSPRRPSKEKMMTYECGEDPIGEPWVKFNIRFYVIALIFLLFDVELAFLFPWATVYADLGMFAYIAGALFVLVLFLADFYLWSKGDLEWIRPEPRIPVLENIIEHAERVSPTGTAPEKEQSPVAS